MPGSFLSFKKLLGMTKIGPGDMPEPFLEYLPLFERFFYLTVGGSNLFPFLIKTYDPNQSLPQGVQQIAG